MTMGISNEDSSVFLERISAIAIVNQAVIKCGLAGLPVNHDNVILFIGDFADPEKPAASSGRRGPVVSTGDPWPPPVEPEQQAARRSAEDVWDARWPESTGTVLNTTRRNPGGQCRWPGSHEQPWSD